MLFQQAPAETFDYMLAGFGVILGAMGLLIISIVVRFRRLSQELTTLKEFEGEP